MSRHKTHLDPETGAPFYPLAHAQCTRSSREAELEAEVKRLQGRLDLLAVGFGVPDGGKYIADWQSRIKKFQAIDDRTPAEGDKRRDCPWKCSPDNPECLCANPRAEINRQEATAAGVIDWKMEAERANRLLAQAEAQVESAFDFAASALAAEKICDCMDNNIAKFEAYGDCEVPPAARELYETAKKLRDLLAPHRKETARLAPAASEGPFNAEMPSSLNDACRRLDLAQERISQLEALVEEASGLIHDLLGLELGSSDRAMAWLDSRSDTSTSRAEPTPDAPQGRSPADVETPNLPQMRQPE